MNRKRKFGRKIARRKKKLQEEEKLATKRKKLQGEENFQWG
jgi:hypothetical protein